MKKLLIISALAVTSMMMFGGCTGKTVQENINDYLDKREKAIKISHIAKCEKDCISGCNVISNDIDRIDCKASCIEVCNEAK